MSFIVELGKKAKINKMPPLPVEDQTLMLIIYRLDISANQAYAAWLRGYHLGT